MSEKFEQIVVPKNKIVAIPVVPDKKVKQFDMNMIPLFLEPANLSHKRYWFTKHFYKCLPLSIANMQGLLFKMPYEIDVFWNGNNSPEDLTITFFEDSEKYRKINFVNVSSEFGHGIFTIHFPLILKTPLGVNLMTIAPPNYPLPGLSPMSGVVETDNLRFTFTLNIKIDISNINIKILKDTPLSGILPIPRYFCDSFDLVNAYDVLDKKLVEKERNVASEHNEYREKQNLFKDKFKGGHYFKGTDIKGNKFKDHQLLKDRDKGAVQGN